MIIEGLRNKFYVLFKTDSDRSNKITTNVLLSFLIKGGSILIGLILVPLTINYINPVQYGIWLTISSIVIWISFFDIGLGNGLRNKLTTSISLGEFDIAKTYVSTTYATLSIFSIIIFIIFSSIIPHINWREFLNIPVSVNTNIVLLLLVVLATFCIQFVVQLLSTILTALHEPALANFISLISQVSILITVLILKFSIPGNLLILVSAITVVPLLVYVISSIILYKSKLEFISPAIQYVDFKYIQEILKLGYSFFIIQIGALVLFQTDNFIILKVIGPQAVTEFNIAYRLFSIVIMFFAILMTPYWAGFTEAHSKNDFLWMNNTMKKLRQFWLIISCIVVPILYLLSDFLYKIWIGSAIKIESTLSILIAFYTILYIAMSLNSYFLNGIGKIKIQLYLYIVVCFINVPLGFFLCNLLGAPGVVLANIIILGFMVIILWYQTNKILTQTATGIWNK